ncbi:hypothetical protein D3C87_1356020 [compost metagenome]
MGAAGCGKGAKLSAVATRSHWPLPDTVALVSETSATPPTATVAPLALLKALLLKLALETNPAAPMA